jgi:hypothetical protein
MSQRADVRRLLGTAGGACRASLAKESRWGVLPPIACLGWPARQGSRPAAAPYGAIAAGVDE